MNVDSRRAHWGLLALTLFTFLFLLGGRSLNEPDEGRYAEIAREMIETGDWLVPQFWYVPHLDKPPLTYWVVAASMSVFGQNEWAVRLPVALAGLSGVWVVWLFGCALGGARAGIWSALILQSSLLYFVMARLLTTDIFLTQFVTWAIYFFWRSWRCLDQRPEVAPDRQTNLKRFLGWHLAAWVAMALGFLTKGPLAIVLPLVTLIALAFFRRPGPSRRKLLLRGALAGLLVFVILVAPWFALVFGRLPGASHFMIFGQAIGHALGTTIKNRRGPLLYYVAILGLGLLPWTPLLGWLWRRAHWRSLNDSQKDGWLMLSICVAFAFCLFSLMRSKLPAYILPVFPALAVLAGLRFFRGAPASDPAPVPALVWQTSLVSPLLLTAGVPLAVAGIFHITQPPGFKLQALVALAAILFLWWIARNYSHFQRAAFTVAFGLLNLYLLAGEIPLFETSLKYNQTLKPLGHALRQTFRPGNAVACWGRLPEGLLFYARPVLSATNRPYLGGAGLDQIPFKFPGNPERFGDLFLPDETSLLELLAGNRRVLVVGFDGAFAHLEQSMNGRSLRFITRVGKWELFSNR